MSSHSNAIIIADEEGLPDLEPGSSRLRHVPHRDHSYPDLERMKFGDDAADPTPSRKRKRTEYEPLTIDEALDEAFNTLQDTLHRELQQLRHQNQKLQKDLRLEKKRHRRTQEEFAKSRKLECKICYLQPDRWVTLLCGHMICMSCEENLTTPKKCPLCRANYTGFIGCRPFAG